MKKENLRMSNINSRSVGLFLATIMLTSMVIVSYSQNDSKVVNRALCPRYSIINDEIAFKIDSIYLSMDSIWPICLQGYMYYPLNEDEVYNDNKLYYYLEAVKQYHSCEPLTEAVVTDKKGFPFLKINEEEILSGCFKCEDDSVWVEYYYDQNDIWFNGKCGLSEDADSVIAWHEFLFTLPKNIDSTWLYKRINRVSAPYGK